MKTDFKNFFVLSLFIGLVLGTATPIWAAGCQSDISAVNAKIRDQYGPDYSKWLSWFGCPVCLGGEMRKDAVVTKKQIKEISTYRNIAYSQLRQVNERQCVAELKNANRMLRIN